MIQESTPGLASGGATASGPSGGAGGGGGGTGSSSPEGAGGGGLVLLLVDAGGLDLHLGQAEAHRVVGHLPQGWRRP